MFTGPDNKVSFNNYFIFMRRPNFEMDFKKIITSDNTYKSIHNSYICVIYHQSLDMSVLKRMTDDEPQYRLPCIA